MAQMTPLHLLPPLPTMPLTPALLTSLIPSPAASRTMTLQLPAPPWPMASTCPMGPLQQTVMASDVNMSDGHQPQTDALECIIASVRAFQTSKLMTVLGTFACCCIPRRRFATPVAAMWQTCIDCITSAAGWQLTGRCAQPNGASSSGPASHG